MSKHNAYIISMLVLSIGSTLFLLLVHVFGIQNHFVKNTTTDPILMYQAGLLALKEQRFVDAYICYILSADGLEPYISEFRDRSGDEKADKSYMVKDIFGIYDDVKTNIPLIRNQLSGQQLTYADRELALLKGHERSNNCGVIHTPTHAQP